MNGGESKFWRNEVKPMLDWMGAEADRLESHATALGRPDVSLCVDGLPWEIELKYCDHGEVKLRPSQRGWFSRAYRVKRPCMVLTKVVGPQARTLYVLNLCGSVPTVSTHINDWLSSADTVWTDTINWDEFREVLNGND